MKISWKIFFVFTSLIIVIFSVFGVWMISAAFGSAYERVISEGCRENKMFRLAFEVNMNAYTNKEMSDEETVAEIAKTVVGNMDQNANTYVIYRENEILYKSGGTIIANSIKQQLSENINSGYETVPVGDKVYAVFLCVSNCNEELYYLESIKDITDIYTERESFYYQYCSAIAVLLVCSGIIVMILSHILTKSVVELSDTTRRFAKGDFDIRAKVKSGDEIGLLANDFNIMADSIEAKIEELVKAARRQEDFSAALAHELKTPLTSIIGYAQMLCTMQLDREETVEAADYIYSEGKRLEVLSRKLLELLAIEKQDYNFLSLSAENIINAAVKINSAMLEKRNVELVTEVEPGIIYGEYDLLVSLLANLIDNARKAVSEKGRIFVIGERETAGYKIYVKDEGCGIPDAEIGKITEAFYMVDKSRARKEGGVGLGLNLCSKIVRIHNAEWTINSIKGKGTEIIISFPDADEKGMI